MTITTLDRETALIIVDLQKGLMAAPTVHPMRDVVRQSSLLAEAFRRHGLPVVLVNVGGSAPGRNEHPRPALERPADWNEIVPDLDPQPQDHRVTKRTWGAFSHTDLADYLARRGVTQVVVTGVATSIGVESTARQAHELGFNVAIAIDATSDPIAEAYTNSVMRIFPRLGETGQTQEIIRLLDSVRR
jgi:nicotinamidase-related amidase